MGRLARMARRPAAARTRGRADGSGGSALGETRLWSRTAGLGGGGLGAGQGLSCLGVPFVSRRQDDPRQHQSKEARDCDECQGQIHDGERTGVWRPGTPGRVDKVPGGLLCKLHNTNGQQSGRTARAAGATISRRARWRSVLGVGGARVGLGVGGFELIDARALLARAAHDLTDTAGAKLVLLAAVGTAPERWTGRQIGVGHQWVVRAAVWTVTGCLAWVVWTERGPSVADTRATSQFRMRRRMASAAA